MDVDCNEKEVKESINMSKNIYYSDTASIELKRDALQNLGHTNCQDVIDFYVDILNNDTHNDMRCDAILYLGWLQAKSSIPFLLQAAKNDNELYFVNHIAKTLCVLEEFELAASILDRICFNEDGSVKKNCIGAYAFAGKDDIVKNYFLSEWKKDNDEERKFEIALRLTEYCIYDITFPILKEVVQGHDRYKRYSAIHGLASIATEEALELIQNCMNDEDIVVANYAKFVITCLKEGRDYHGRRDK
jgi:HEAT repeat protein